MRWPNRKTAILALAGLAIALLLVSSLTAILREDGGDFRAFTTLRGETATIYGGAGVYRFDTVFKAVAFRGVNWSDLLAGVPLLLAGAVLHARGRRLGGALLAALFGYLAYFYLIGVMGNAFNELFLVWTALFAAGWGGLALVLGGLDLASWSALPERGFPRRAAVVYLFALAGLLLAQYLAQILEAYQTGLPPTSLGSYTTLELAAVEMGIMIPLHLAGGFLLLIKRAVGYLLATVVTCMGALAFLALSVSQWMLFAGYGLGTWMDLALMIFLAVVAGGFALRMLQAIRD